ncbi:DUF1902 domain-containing protein [Devosia sp.]|uniref:DUF1902 domain-containing protein n=1 Tax=Devosia sp. TaxID=1871048 RepID=UPI0035B0A2DE
MVKRSFTVRALWDEEAQVYYSESDIDGFHIEAETIDEFESVMMDLAPDLIVANHMEKQAVSLVNASNLASFIPAILWQRPATPHVMA